MDRRLRTRYRDLLQEPGDPALAEALRSSLEHADPLDRARVLDDLIGGYFAPTSWENSEAPERRHLRFCGSGLLAPLPPAAATLRWSLEGTLLGLTHGVVLVEAEDGALVGHDLRSGQVRWRVPGLTSGAEPLSPEEGRRERVGWAVAPWGAVELVAEFDAPLTYRRRGRYHAELGRVTERAPVDRLEAGIWLRLQVARSLGDWSQEPTLLSEGAGGEEGLCDGDLRLTRWDDSLYELELDLREPRFAVRTLEQEQGEGHAFELRQEPSPRIDPIPWSHFPEPEELDPAEPGALEEIFLQKVSRGDIEWTLDPERGALSCGGERWTQLSEAARGVARGAELDLIPYQGCAWLLGPEDQVRVFQPGGPPRELDLRVAFDGRRVGGTEGIRGYGLEGGLLLQGGSEAVSYLG